MTNENDMYQLFLLLIYKSETFTKLCTKTLNSVRVMVFKGYHTLQGDNSLKSVERFDHMMFVCRFQASRRSKPQREKLLCG